MSEWISLKKNEIPLIFECSVLLLDLRFMNFLHFHTRFMRRL